MEEILPGVQHWTAFPRGIGQVVHSYLYAPAHALIDPMLPEEGLDALDRYRPERILLTNRHHYRQSDELRERFGCPVLCHEAGLHEFEGGPEVRGFSFGQEVASGVDALELDAICPEEPERVKGDIRHALRRLLDVDFDALLLAHGEPLRSGAKAALREFCRT